MSEDEVATKLAVPDAVCAECWKHADAAGRLRYPDGSAARPLQPAQDIGYKPHGLSQ